MACPACQGWGFRKLFVKKNRKFYQCRSCGLERQWPLPTQAELCAYYEQSYRDGMYREFVSANDMKQLTARARFKQIRDWVRQGTWLDVGCSDGVFLNVLRDEGVAAEGIDVSQGAIDLAREKGLLATCGTLLDAGEGKSFQMITAFDVLEHVIDPWRFMQEVAQRLSPGGRAVISVPNLKSWSHFLMGRRWYFYIPEEHLHYFSPTSLTRLCERAGLSVCMQRPTYKPLTYDYSVIQFREYNPWIYRILNTFGKLLPSRVRTLSVPLYIGEWLLIAEKPKK